MASQQAVEGRQRTRTPERQMKKQARRDGSLELTEQSQRHTKLKPPTKPTNQQTAGRSEAERQGWSNWIEQMKAMNGTT